MAEREPLLAVRNLSVQFQTRRGLNRAVDDVSFDLFPGETLAVVGESGSGKSALSRAIMQLLPVPPAIYAGGEIRLERRDLLALDEAAMRRLRGAQMAMIFQEPMLSLNPLMTIGAQIGEGLRAHTSMGRSEARSKAVSLLTEVGIADAPRRHDQYPHELSGGMRQRAMIAMALACEPRLLIADEPTTALDVTIQAQVLHLIDRLKRGKGMSVLLVTHNFGVVNQVADRVVVMYAGSVVEVAPKTAILKEPLHPYTKGLLASVPRLHGQEKRVHTIAGMMASGTALPSGCRFHPRCSACMDICTREDPPVVDHGGGHSSKCWLYAEPDGPDAMPRGALTRAEASDV